MSNNKQIEKKLKLPHRETVISTNTLQTKPFDNQKIEIMSNNKQSMKITKREWARPGATIMLWAIPTMSYTLQKLAGVQMNSREYLWWIGIPGLVMLWAIINFKVVKDNEQQ